MLCCALVACSVNLWTVFDVVNVMALKKTSEVITISHLIEQGVTNAFQVDPVDLQLNPLDNEVFVVTGVKIDMLSPQPFASAAAAGVLASNDEIGITTTRPTVMPNLSNSNCLAYARRDTTAGVNAALELVSFSCMEQGPIDTPDANLDYIGIIATSDLFVSVDSNASITTTDAAIRVYGYRAKADAATYAALVQSEVLSS